MGQVDPEVTPPPHIATQIFYQIYTDLKDDQKSAVCWRPHLAGKRQYTFLVL